MSTYAITLYMYATSQGTSNLLRTNVFQHFITYKHTCMPINAKKTYECGYISPISYHHFFIIYYVISTSFYPSYFLLQIPCLILSKSLSTFYPTFTYTLILCKSLQLPIILSIGLYLHLTIYT